MDACWPPGASLGPLVPRHPRKGMAGRNPAVSAVVGKPQTSSTSTAHYAWSICTEMSTCSHPHRKLLYPEEPAPGPRSQMAPRHCPPARDLLPGLWTEMGLPWMLRC